jgi:hypothetical protein
LNHKDHLFRFHIHYSTVPLFHHSMWMALIRSLLEAVFSQKAVEIPRRFGEWFSIRVRKLMRSETWWPM